MKKHVDKALTARAKGAHEPKVARVLAGASALTIAQHTGLPSVTRTADELDSEGLTVVDA